MQTNMTILFYRLTFQKCTSHLKSISNAFEYFTTLQSLYCVCVHIVDQTYEPGAVDSIQKQHEPHRLAARSRRVDRSGYMECVPGRPSVARTVPRILASTETVHAQRDRRVHHRGGSVLPDGRLFVGRYVSAQRRADVE